MPYHHALFRPEKSRWYYYPACTATTYAAYVNRHKPVVLPEYKPELTPSLYKHIKKFKVQASRWSLDEYCDRMTGKEKFYRDNLAFYRQRHRIPTHVTPFTKIEKLSTKKYKAPRMIQGRHPIFNIHYGSFIKPIEKMVMYGRYSRNFGKGDYTMQAAKIIRMCKKYKYYTEADHSTFDAHVTVEQLQMTHIFYQACYLHNQELRELSRKTLINKCIGRNGESYIVRGTRMSGDVDTSLGNSLINYAIIMEVLATMGLEGDCIVNGDDSIIFTNEPVDIERAAKHFKTFNMDTKLLPSVEDIHQVEFCQTRLVFNSAGIPTMMMNPKKSVQKFGMTYTVEDKNYHQYIYEVALCNAMLSASSSLGHHWAKAFNIDLATRFDYEFKFLEHIQKIKLQELAPPNCDSIENTLSQYIAYPKYDKYINYIYELARIYHSRSYNPHKTLDKLIVIDHINKVLEVH